MSRPTIQSLAAAQAYLGSKPSRPLANNTRLERRPDGIAVRLHATDVVTFLNSGSIRLDSGGWRTVTTRQRMNEFSPFRVWTERGVMYVSPDHPFADGMEIDQAGRVSYPGEAPDPAADLRLAQAINSYAKAYAEALAAGEVGLPSGADCWGCVMRTDSGDNPLGSDGEHLREHIRERYYVPALLSLARDFRRLAPAAQDWIARKMHNAPTNGWPGDDYGKRETAKAIRSYMRHALGLSA